MKQWSLETSGLVLRLAEEASSKWHYYYSFKICSFIEKEGYFRFRDKDLQSRILSYSFMAHISMIKEKIR